MEGGADPDRIPRDPDDDYTSEAAEVRREFLRERTGAELEHVGRNSFDPSVLPGNVENFIGVAQVPIGIAGPLLVDGEHAQGEFYVPMATAEGTLVASYNRGMKLLRAVGGVKTTVLATMTFLAVAPVTSAARQITAEQPGAVTAASTRTERLMQRHECSPTGFGPDVAPRSALVRRDGHLQHVSFEEGWAVYTGAARGRFVAVCRV